jgi:L-threonylcarbamoyladenylate synthase
MEKVPETAWMLLEASEDQRPMTIIYPRAKNLASNLLAEDGSVGIRITQELFSKALCEQLRCPIVSTSVNISGEPAAKIYDEIAPELLRAVDYVCYYRREDKSMAKPSSIIKIDEKERITIIRV